MATVTRHKTAINRIDLSRPVRLALEDGVISDQTSVFDYGCGKGGDLRRLQERGISCSGWDPAHYPQGEKTKSDIVNVGYVINVIEDPAERATHYVAECAGTDTKRIGRLCAAHC